MRRYYVFLCLLLALSCNFISAQTPLKKIVVLGSSSAYGNFGNPPLFPRDSSVVGRLSKFYKAANIIDTIYNLAQTGTNIFQAMPSWYVPTGNTAVTYTDHSKNITAALALQPDLILVYFPTNAYDFLPKQDVMAAFRTIKATSDSANVPMYILSTQPRGSLSMPEHQVLLDLRDSIKNAFGNHAIMIYDELAKPADIMYMNPEFWLGYPDYLGTTYMDSVHLNNVGHSIVYERIRAANIFATDAALPVSILNFSGSNSPNGNLLKWSVANETDFNGYYIERSEDGISYLSVGFITATTASSSAGVKKYEFLDHGFSGLKQYYRLKEVNKSGNYKYSQVLFLNNKDIKSLTLGSSYPNPVHDIYTVVLNAAKNDHVVLFLRDENGRLIKKQTVNIELGVNSVPLNVIALHKGVYFLTIVSNSEGKSFINRFLKQ